MSHQPQDRMVRECVDVGFVRVKMRPGGRESWCLVFGRHDREMNMIMNNSRRKTLAEATAGSAMVFRSISTVASRLIPVQDNHLKRREENTERSVHLPLTKPPTAPVTRDPHEASSSFPD